MQKFQMNSPKNVNYDLALEKIQKALDDIHTRLNDFNVQHNSLRQKPDVPSEFQYFKDDINTKIKSLTDNISHLTNRISDIHSRLDSVDRFSQRTSHVIEHHKNQINGVIKDQSDISSFQKVRNTTLEHAIVANTDNLKKYSEKMIDELKSELSASPSSILQTNKEVAKKLEESIKGTNNAIQMLQGTNSLISRLEGQLKKFDERLKKLEDR